MTTNYILDIVILLAAAVILVPLFRAIGLGAVPGTRYSMAMVEYPTYFAPFAKPVRAWS